MKAGSLLTLLLTIGVTAGCSGTSSDMSGADASSTRGPRVGSPVTTDQFRLLVNQVQPGTPKNEVLRALGKPDVNEKGVAGVQRPGPQPPATINVGSRYEHWVYLRGDNEYHIFMGPSLTDPGHWAVMSVAANPRTAVAH